MSIHMPTNDQIISQYHVREPRVTAVAVSSGLIFAVILFYIGMPLLVSAGLWLLGMALVFIGYAFVSYHRFATPVWDTAIAGQIVGFVGIGLLLIASLGPV